MVRPGGHVEGPLATDRQDRWWLGPALTAVSLGAWLGYYAWAASRGRHWSVGPYVSPFYLTYRKPPRRGWLARWFGASTEDAPGHALWGRWPRGWPGGMAPALVIGLLPGSFRITCYYYRKAYYRSLIGSPPACAVGAVPARYRGETGLLVLQNAHRYSLYLALLLLPLLHVEALQSMRWRGRFGVGVGSVLLVANASLLTAYTLGCHSWRHLIGGRLDCFTCDRRARARYGAWSLSSWLNARHATFAWASLASIALTDAWIRAVAAGRVPDLNTWHGVTWARAFDR